MFRTVLRLLVALGVLIAVLTFVVKKRYGGETVPFASRLTEPPLLPSSALEVVAKLDNAPGNIAVSDTGRVFFTFHPEGRPESMKVAELVGGKPVPFPNEEFQHSRFDTVFSIRIDSLNRLWTLDPGYHGLRTPRLLAFNLDTREVVEDVDLSSVAGMGSYVQDFQVTPGGKNVIIADTSAIALNPALIVYDVKTHDLRRVLEGSPSTAPKDYSIFANGHEMSMLHGFYKMHPGVDSITVDHRGVWCYFGPMSHESMFRIAVEDLRVASRANLLANVEAFGPKPQSDGISIDSEGTIYITDVEHNAIEVLNQDHKLQTLIHDERLRWPDGLGFGPGGWLYVTDSDLPDLIMRSREHVQSSAPFYIYRVQTGKSGQPGH